ATECGLSADVEDSGKVHDIIIQDNQIDMGYTKSNIGLTVDNSFDIMIKSNSLRNFKQGINITSSHSLIVQDNFIDHCETGMKLFNVSSSIFTGNKLQNGYTGIDGQDIHDSMLTENQLLDMDNAGITVQVTMNVTISNSFFDCCANVGIVVSNSNDLKLKMNTVLTSRIGISILSCNSSFIAANQLEDNLNGIYIGLSNEHSVFVIFNRIYRSCNNGIFITGNPGTNATIAGNLIQDSHEYGFLSQGFVESQVFHNNFILTKRNEYDYQKQAQSMSEASFYYNYWSDHPDIDTDHDGIVDSSYDVEGPTSDSTPMADLVPQVLVTAEINFSSYGFKGTGSSGDPYQVNDLHFYSKDTALLVVKAGTTNYLEITDCYFEGKNRLFDGIQITTDNVNIKSVHGCQFERLDHGIFAYDLDSTDISGNTFLDNNHGVFIDQATDLTLEDNVFIKNDCGMEIYNLDTGTIQNNGFTDSERTGLRLKTLINGNITDNIFRNNSIGLYIINSTDIVVTENIFTSNVVIGLNIESSYILTIQENVIMSNLNYGIQMIKSNTTDILNNTFLDNENYGMYLVATVSSINVRYNDFINNLFRNKHVFSDGIVNFAYNYWDTWIAPDNDDNGIVDDPYLIPGIAGNYDNTPVTISYHMANAPVIINPNGGETFNGTIMIEWSSVLDKQGHDVSYNLYYSFGNEWITIASNLQATNYTWDTFTVPNSDYCILKVMAICTQNIYTFAVSNNFSILNHVFTPITFVYPALVDEVIMDTVVIDWSDVVDAWNHPVKYDLEVSTDGGMIWSDLATNLTLSEYSWDSTTGNDSLNVLFRVTAHCSEGLEASVPSKVVILHNDLSYPEIINPVAGDTVQGYTTIAWNMSTDSLGMSVEYSIYYSMNGGIIWNLLVANLPQETTTYSWDTTLFDDSTYYLVKIVAATPDGLTREAVMDEVFTVQNDFWVTKTTRITSAPGLELVMALVVLVSVTMRKMYRQKKTRDKICNF
ncbi:MAG: NosD domain-containing protein, partial [Candidatus Odinarchaeota archaeon]